MLPFVCFLYADSNDAKVWAYYSIYVALLFSAYLAKGKGHRLFLSCIFAFLTLAFANCVIEGWRKTLAVPFTIICYLLARKLFPYPLPEIFPILEKIVAGNIIEDLNGDPLMKKPENKHKHRDKLYQKRPINRQKHNWHHNHKGAKTIKRQYRKIAKTNESA